MLPLLAGLLSGCVVYAGDYHRPITGTIDRRVDMAG
jgi:hypothetical protein